MMLHLPWAVWISGGTVVLVTFSLVFGLVIIGEQESGLVVRRYGPQLAAGRIIALDDEAGYQARMLAPGWHFPLWKWKFKVERVPLIEVAPGEIALVVAKDGAPTPNERVLAREIGPGLEKAHAVAPAARQDLALDMVVQPRCWGSREPLCRERWSGSGSKKQITR